MTSLNSASLLKIITNVLDRDVRALAEGLQIKGSRAHLQANAVFRDELGAEQGALNLRLSRLRKT